MTVMQHDIYSRGLTESFGTAVALLIAFALGARQLAPEIAAIAGTLASGLVAFALARRLFPFTPVPRSPSDDLVRPLLSSSAPIALYDLLNIAIMRIDLIMLVWFVGRVPSVTLETLGIYAAAGELGRRRRRFESHAPSSLRCARGGARDFFALSDQRGPPLGRDFVAPRVALAVASTDQTVARRARPIAARFARPLHDPWMVGGADG